MTEKQATKTQDTSTEDHSTKKNAKALKTQKATATKYSME